MVGGSRRKLLLLAVTAHRLHERV